MKFSLSALAALLKNPVTRGLAKSLIVNNIDTIIDLFIHYLEQPTQEAPKS